MHEYTPKTFTISSLIGISDKAIAEHIKLYEGYVKHVNLIRKRIKELEQDGDLHMYDIGELRRRFSFEFDGMRNHEYYFASLEGGAHHVNTGGDLYKKIEKDFGSFDMWLVSFKTLALTRGIGWAMLYYDKESDQLVQTWVDEQHLGHLTGLSPILALDMWEHSFVIDYLPSGKKQYVEDFFKNLNWTVIENNFK